MARRSESQNALAAQPPGFWRIVVAQFWDNLALYGARVLLVLFLFDLLGRPQAAAAVWGLGSARRWASAAFGITSDQAFASFAFGIFAAACSVTPVIGGWISDRFLGTRSSIILGAVLMVAGHAMLALERPLLPGLALLVCGNGLFKSNITSDFAKLYPVGDPRTGSGFQFLYIAVNCGVMAAPFVCGTLGELVGWHVGFAAAAVAMAIGLLVYIAGPAPSAEQAHRIAPGSAPAAGSSLTARLLLIAGVALFFVGNEEIANAVLLWIRSDVWRTAGRSTIPATWFIALVSIACVIGAPFLVRLWARLGQRDLRRRAIAGTIIGAAAYILLAIVTLVGAGGPIAPIWPAAALLLWAIAYLHVWPTGFALMAQFAPSARGLWMGLYFLAAVIADLIVAFLGGFYGRTSHFMFFALHACVILAGGALLAAIPGARLRGAER